MKKTLVVTAVVGLALLGTAAWATLPQVDPATVPIGNLVANRVSTPLKVKVDGHAAHRLRHGTEVFVRHLEFPAGTSTGWHTHLGPVLVNVVRGSLTLDDGADKTCTGVTYTAGHGFIDPGSATSTSRATRGRSRPTSTPPTSCRQMPGTPWRSRHRPAHTAPHRFVRSQDGAGGPVVRLGPPAAPPAAAPSACPADAAGPRVRTLTAARRPVLTRVEEPVTSDRRIDRPLFRERSAACPARRAAAAVLQAARACSIWPREGPGAGRAVRNRSRTSEWRSRSSSRSGGSSRSTRRATARSSRGSAGPSGRPPTAGTGPGWRPGR
jgi:hypothetical protein